MLTGCTINIGDGGVNITGTGDMVSREIDVADFNAISVSGAFNVIYRQSQDTALTVVMQSNLFDHLETDVRGGVLQIGTRRSFTTIIENRPRLYIYAPYLAGVNFFGAVSASGWDTVEGPDFTIDASGAVSMNINLDVHSLDVNVSGAGNLTLSGAAVVIHVNGSGAFNLYAGGLAISGGRVDLSGVGSVYLSSLENIDVNVSGLGRVREVQ